MWIYLPITRLHLLRKVDALQRPDVWQICQATSRKQRTRFLRLSRIFVSRRFFRVNHFLVRLFMEIASNGYF
jgi:hypothetical protein